jgi:hypothetical protein
MNDFDMFMYIYCVFISVLFVVLVNVPKIVDCLPIIP